MKLLHIIYTSGVSGAEKYLLDLLPALARQGIYCELICICPTENEAIFTHYCQQLENKGIKATLLTANSKFSYFPIARKIARYLRSRNIYIVHSHLFSADFIAVLIKKVFIKKLVIFSTKHGYQEEYLIQYGLGNRKIPHNFYYYIARYVIKNIDHNIAVSKALSRLYGHIKLGNKAMPYIHHGINLLPESGLNEIIPGDPKILMVGRLSVIKGHRYLIHALPQIIKKFPNLMVILVGEGPLKSQLQAEAENLGVSRHITFTGFAKPGDYSPQCQVMVLPSLFESFGLVYIESFALKIPLVAFDAEAGNEIITNNETGLLVPKEDVNSLAEKIIFLLESPDERRRIRENAYQEYLKKYNVDRMAGETAQWYQTSI